MKPTVDIIPTVSIHPDRLILYNQIIWHPARPCRHEFSTEGLFAMDRARLLGENYDPKVQPIINSDRKSHGKVSIQARRKIEKAIDYLLVISSNKSQLNRISGRSINFKVAFITLTLPSKQIHSDKEIKNKCLNQFITELCKVYKVKNFIWRSERQQNLNVHFHILIDKFIPYQEIRDRWNRIINKLGYVDRYRQEQQNWHSQGFRVRPELLKTWSKEKQFQAYLRGSKNHWNSPNSTDIHSIRKITNIKRYIVKYMTKQNEDKLENSELKELENLEKIETGLTEIYESGRIWACSQNLSKITGARLELDSLVQKEMEQIIEDTEIYRFTDKYFSIYYIDIEKLRQKGLDYLFKKFCEYLIKRFNFNYQL